MVSVPFPQTRPRFSFKKPAMAFWKSCLQLAQFRREHALLYSPVLLGSGIAAYFSISFEPSPQLVMNLWFVALAALLFAHDIYSRKPELNYLRLICFSVCLIVGGFFLAQYRTHHISSPLLAKDIKFADVMGSIKEVDILPGNQGQKLTLTHLSIEDLKT